MSYKPITVKFDETLYKKINKHPLSNSELIRKGCTMFLQSGKKEKAVQCFYNQVKKIKDLME